MLEQCEQYRAALILSAARAQNKRGGRVKLHALVGTESEFDHAEKGDALYAFELALCARAPMSNLLPLVKNTCERQVMQGSSAWHRPLTGPFT